MRAALAILAILAACGAPAKRSWIERDLSGQDHATAAPREAAAEPAPELDAGEAALVAALDKPGAAVGAIALDLARLAHHRGDDRQARGWLDRAERAADADRAAIAALAGDLALGPVDPAVIAVLLPLSGPYRAIGEELRVAIELAPAAGTRWLYLDTQGTTDGAAAAVATAVGKGAVGILGPVGQREAIAAARAAALARVPIALLAPADGGDASAGVFRVVASPADEGRAVAQLAAQDSFPTVAVLAPRDDLGREAADGFVAEATRLGLRVTARGEYDPTGGDVEPDVRAFLDLVPAKNPRFAAHLARRGKAGWTTFSPDIPYTLLYLPDSYDRAAIVAAYLPYYNVELRTTAYLDPAQLAKKHAGHIPQVVQLIGGAGWHHPSLPVRGGPAVQGALIVDDYAGEQGGELAAQLAAGFRQRTGRPPSTAAAQAHDAALLVAAARAAIATASDPRQALRGQLAHARLADGACGPAAIGPDGELERTPAILEVQGDELIAAP